MSEPLLTPVLKSLRLAGERVVLRPITGADAAAAFPLLHEQSAVLRWVPWNGPQSLEELERHYSEWRRFTEGGWNYTLAILDRAIEEFRGALTLRFGGHAGSGDVGYWITPEHHGQGLGTEAVRLVCHLAFEHLAAVLLVAQTDVRNAASQRVLEKAGFRLDLETTVAGSAGPRQEAHLSQSRRAWRRRATDPEPQIVEVGLETAVSG